MQRIFSASRIFTGNEWLTDHAIVVKDKKIESLLPKNQTADSAITKEYRDLSIIPGFIDAQVYGAGGKLFAAFPDAETLKLMEEIFLKAGTFLFVPTVATNTLDLFKKCIDAVKEYWKQGGKAVYGLHLEGPWIHPAKRGAHVEKWIHSPKLEEVKDLLDYGDGVISMITLAPEVCDQEVIDLIHSKNIVVSAGHSNATFEVATNSFKSGINTVTHLYNAMSGLHHREPGLVGAVLHHDKVKASIIPDGHHVDYVAISIAKKLMKERLFAITDAVTETTEGPYQHQLAGDKYECNKILSGSAISMHDAFINLIRHAGIDEAEALKMCSIYPAKAIGCDDRFGKIAPGYPGQFLVIDKQLAIVEMIT